MVDNDKISKKDIINYVSQTTNLSNEKTSEVVREIINFITKNILDGKTISINKFGTFTLKKRKYSHKYDFQAKKNIKTIFTKHYIQFKNSQILKKSLHIRYIDNM